MTKARAWIVLALGAVAWFGCVNQRLTAVQVLRRAQEAVASGDAQHVVLDVEIDAELLQDTLSIELWEEPPDRLKLQVLSAANLQLRGLVFVTDGQQSTSYSPQLSQVTIGPASVVKMPAVVERLIRVRREWLQSADPQRARLIAREREGGLVVYKLEAPLSPSGHAQYWVDAQRWWVRRVTYEDAFLGTGVISVREIESYEHLSDAQLDFRLPGGATVAEVTAGEDRQLTFEEARMAAGFRLRAPTFLPSGTVFSAAYQIDESIVLVYEGPQPFTLVQGTSIGALPDDEGTVVGVLGREATLIQDQAHGGLLLTWQEDGLQFSIAGPVEYDDLLRIAASLE